MNGITKLLKWQPRAKDIRKAGRCDDCKNNTLLFYHLPGFGSRERVFRDGSVHIDGGYYCPNCGFGNAGCMPLDRYESAEVVRE